jgi:hypothetical protein
VCFDVPRDEVAVIEYKSNMFNDGPEVGRQVSHSPSGVSRRAY